MDRKIKNYVDTLFIDVPKTKKATKIKNDLIKDMMTNSKDLLNEGLPYYKAYSQTIANFAEVDDLIAEAMIPDDNENKFGDIYPDNYNRRTKQLGFLSIALFIVAPLILIVTAFFNSIIVGFFLVPTFTIIGCILSIYIGSLKSQDKDTEFSEFIKEESKLIKAATVFSCIIITILYCVTGLFTEIWHPTWIIFFTIPIINELLLTLAEIVYLRGGNDNNA